MPNKLGIIGLGNVGSTLANQVVQTGLVSDLVLIDDNFNKLKADALDLKDSQTFGEHFTNITINDYQALNDADILVIAVGDIKAYFGENPDRWVELAINATNVKKIVEQLNQTSFHGLIVVISNPCDAITTLFQKGLDYPRQKIFGTGTLLDTSRLRRHLSEYSGLSPRDISGYVLGEHGDSQFVAWSTVTDDLVREEDKVAIENAARFGGQEVFNGKRYTNFAIANCAYQVVKAVLARETRVFPLSFYQPTYDLYLSLPVRLRSEGIGDGLPIKLTSEEERQLDRSAQAIRQKLNQLNE